MKFKDLTPLLLLVAMSAHADKTLRWSKLAVTAHLDADGVLHVQERHSIVFNGDWNGAERTFRKSLENVIHLERITRDDIPLRYNKKLANVDDYAWSDQNTLRWRSRLPSDPPFNNKEITYEIDYTDSYILKPTDGEYVIDHNFGMPDLKWPLDHFTLDFTLDPAWRPDGELTRHGNIVTARLRHPGTPAAVNTGPPPLIRFALIAILFIGTAILALLFIKRERALGRFHPLEKNVDRRWLDDNVFKFAPEVVGAAWDNRTGSAEVAAVIARMVHEGKLSSRIEKRGWLSGGDDLVLTLQRDKNSFEGYEKALVNGLFIDGDTTSTEKVKEYYKQKKRGFDPVSKIKGPLNKKLREIGAYGGAPKVNWKPTIIFFIAGLALLVAGGFFGALNIVGGIITACLILGFYVIGLIGAFDYRRRLTNLGISALEFVPQILLILTVPLVAFAFRLSSFTMAGLVSIALAAVSSILNIAKSRDGGERLERRRQLAAAREYFARELRQPKPSLDDSWFPYLLAFGLGTNVDRWFRSFGDSPRSSGMFSSGTSSSSSSSGSSWTGGGGAFGGAGASGTWAVAAAGMASGVAAPGSGGGGGGGGGGSSGGGGGGGW